MLRLATQSWVDGFPNLRFFRYAIVPLVVSLRGKSDDAKVTLFTSLILFFTGLLKPDSQNVRAPPLDEKRRFWTRNRTRFYGCEENRIAARLWRCRKACNSRAFCPQIVYTRPPLAGGFCFLLTVDVLGAGGAVFCPAGAGEDARAADFAAAEFFGAENGLFQLRLLGQHFARPRTLRSCPGVRRKSVPSGRCSMGSSLCIFGLLCDEPTKSFHLTSCPIHPIRCIDWIDRLILLYLDLFLIR